MIHVLSFLLLSFIFVSNLHADEVWQRVSGIEESDMKEIVIYQGIIYASSEKNLYRSEDHGETWEVVFSARGDGNVINFICASGGDIFVCTDRGLYKGSNGRTYKRMFKGVGNEESSILHIAFSQDGRIYLGTKSGLFISSDSTKTWQKYRGELGNTSIRWISFLGKDLLIAAETGVYKGIDGNWKRVFMTETEEAEYDTAEADEITTAVKPVNSILVSEENIYLAADSGIFISRNKGDTFGGFPSTGLLSKKVKRILFKDSLYTATDKGVFVFPTQENIWKASYKGMASDRTNAIAVGANDTIWAATDKGLYKLLQNYNADLISEGEKDVLAKFSHEPNIREVQDAAIRYAEVHPDKIKEWRDAARQKALLPNVSVGLDRYVTDYWHWDSGTNPDTLQKGKDAVSWDITMTWDMSELIWNDDQTSIDTRSKLMVQLRDDILDEITRTYFERRRMQIESYLSPPTDLRLKLEKELRIQELTADIDALTGGYFSSQIK